MSVHIISDSGCDILPEEAQQRNLEIIPLKTRFGTEEFLDGVTISRPDFYRRMAASPELPTTSQITPFEYEARFQAAADRSEEILCITLSAGLSGCYQSACIAAESVPASVVDSAGACSSQRILVLRALELRDAGLSAAEIAQTLEQEKPRVRLYAVLDTLEYLKKGGRISSAAAIAGSLLAIKPVIAIENGLVVVRGKARGAKNGAAMLNQLITAAGGIDARRPFCLGYTGAEDHLLQAYLRDSAQFYAGLAEPLPVSGIGCAIGTHAGPGAIAVAFFAPEGVER